MSVNASARVVAPGANRAPRASARLPHPPAEALPLQCPVPSAGRASRNLRAARRAGITIAAAADVGGAAFSVTDCEVTYGLVKERGPRGEMEDEATVVPSASLGYVYTGTTNAPWVDMAFRAPPFLQQPQPPPLLLLDNASALPLACHVLHNCAH